MDLSIKTYGIIAQGVVTKNGIEVFSSKEPIQNFLTTLYRHLDVAYPKFFKMDHLSKLGFLSAELLDVQVDDTNRSDTAVFIWNKSASLDTDENYQTTIAEANYFPSPSVFVYTLPNIVIGEICIRHKIFGENTFFVTEKFDANAMVMFVNQTFRDTDVKQAIVGWVECYKENYEAILFYITRNQIDANKFNIETINKLLKWKN